MSATDAAKLHAAETAAGLVQSGMTVGLGSGTTASEMVRLLAARVATERIEIVGVATSAATAALARSLGIPLRDLDDVAVIDLNLDGADEIDPAFQMIKGRGGALLREKIVVNAARRRVTIVTSGKRVDRLGATMPLPVEVSPFGLRHTDGRIQRLGASTALRLVPGGGPFVTDGGNRILDCRFPPIDDPEALEGRLKQIAGVLETGLFLGLCDHLLVGTAESVEQFDRPAVGS